MREPVRKELLREKIAQFVKQYRRKRGRSIDPNDRHYDRELEERIKKMRPEDLDELMNQ